MNVNNTKELTEFKERSNINKEFFKSAISGLSYNLILSTEIWNKEFNEKGNTNEKEKILSEMNFPLDLKEEELNSFWEMVNKSEQEQFLNNKKKEFDDRIKNTNKN